MPTIHYPNNPNTDTAFIEQDDGTRNRALMTAPQDISSLELPNNPNSTKGYVTVDGKKQRVVLTADISGSGGGSSLPDQTGHSGEFLTTDGTDASWAAVDALPSQTGQSGKFLTTDGTDASWATINALQNTATGSDGLTIAGTASTYQRATNVGVSSSAKTSGTAFGRGASAGDYAVALGQGSVASNDAVAVGFLAKAQGGSSIAIVADSFGTAQPTTGSAAIAIGQIAAAQANFAIQLGNGINSTAYTFSVGFGINNNYRMLDSDGTIPTARLTKANTTVTLAVADWSSNTQTVSVTGVTATSVVLVAPDSASQSDYTSAGILCTAQGAGTLTFTCSTTPTNAITVNVVAL